MENLKIFGFDIVPGTQGSELAYEVSLEKAIVEARNHREILEDDPELAYMLPFPPVKSMRSRSGRLRRKSSSRHSMTRQDWPHYWS